MNIVSTIRKVASWVTQQAYWSAHLERAQGGGTELNLMGEDPEGRRVQATLVLPLVAPTARWYLGWWDNPALRLQPSAHVADLMERLIPWLDEPVFAAVIWGQDGADPVEDEFGRSTLAALGESQAVRFVQLLRQGVDRDYLLRVLWPEQFDPDYLRPDDPEPRASSKVGRALPLCWVRGTQGTRRVAKQMKVRAERRKGKALLTPSYNRF